MATLSFHFQWNILLILSGKVGITLDCDWKEPITTRAYDRYAAERALQFKLGWFANPVFGNGDYPAVMKQVVAQKSRAENRNVSRLPEFTESEKIMNKGTVILFDFFLKWTENQLGWWGLQPARVIFDRKFYSDRTITHEAFWIYFNFTHKRYISFHWRPHLICQWYFNDLCYCWKIRPGKLPIFLLFIFHQS